MVVQIIIILTFAFTGSLTTTEIVELLDSLLVEFVIIILLLLSSIVELSI